MSTTKRFRRGVVASLLSHLVGGLDQLLLVPLFLACWGKETYGEWLCLFAAVSYVTIADLGFSSFVVNRLNQQNARAERDEYLTTLHSALAFTLTVSGIVLAALVLGATATPFAEWLRVERLGGVTMVACLLSIQVTLSIPRGLVLGVYRTVGEYDRGAMLANARRLVALLVTGGLLILGAGPVAIAAGQLLPLTAVLAIAYWDVRRRHPWIVFGVKQRQRGLARSFVRPSLYFLGVQLSLVLVLQGTTVAAGVLFGATVVATFVTTRTLTNLVRQFTGSLSNALWPEITALAARGRLRTLHGVHRTFVKGLTTFALAATCFLFLTGPQLFELWTHGALPVDQGLLNDFLLLLLVQTPWTASSYILLATNEHAGLARLQLVAAVLSLFVGIGAAAMFGPRGLIWGILIVETALCAFVVPRMATRVLGSSFVEYLTDVYGRGLLVVACAGGALFAIGPVHRFDTPVNLLLQGMLTVFVVIALAFLLWLTPGERGRITRLIGANLRTRQLRTQRRES